MVSVATAVIADGCPDVLGNLFNVATEVFDALLGKAFTFQSGVKIRHVRIVVLVVMDLHRLGVDVWLQRIVGVGQWRKCIGHGGVSLFLVNRAVRLPARYRRTGGL